MTSSRGSKGRGKDWERASLHHGRRFSDSSPIMFHIDLDRLISRSWAREGCGGCCYRLAYHAEKAQVMFQMCCSSDLHITLHGDFARCFPSRSGALCAHVSHRTVSPAFPSPWLLPHQ